ncbi:hypothetical protein BD626DRAFT_477840 [Schizophyllum amplum]|uniref:Alpha/Beta hydrolase protein n=1 Tax=Schizophyllum amplum TaxID=97359 RepID=A0A550D0J4_9AGAR|nr:hypothetical protein BD626DRAFT_477840 [Auriculariopsis ampla]
MARRTTTAATAPSTIAAACLFLATLTHAIDPMWLQSSYSGGENPPGWQEGDSPGQTVFLTDGGSDVSGNYQLPSCPTILIGSAQVNGDPDSGWQGLPTVVGMDLARFPLAGYGDAVLPYYIERGKNTMNIKRALVVQPGKSRDAWKYGNLARNSMICAAANDSAPVNMDEVLVTAPMWFSDADQAAGAVGETDVYFKSNRWYEGGMSRGPGDVEISSVTALDQFIGSFMNREVYPNLETVVVLGHSLGAQFAQRYALMRDAQDGDDRVRYWIGNPGSFAWLTTARPETIQSSCADSYNAWPYGGNATDPIRQFPSTFKDEFEGDWSGVVSRYLTRTLRHAQGEADDGPGDTHCEAQAQGSTHLERGQNFQSMLECMDRGRPGNIVFDYIPDTSHQDYPMMAHPLSQYRLFLETDTSTGDATVGDEATCNAATTTTVGDDDDDDNNGAAGRGRTMGAWTIAAGMALGAVTVGW